MKLFEDENRAFGVGRKARRLPLLRDPAGAAQGRFIGAGEMDRKVDGLDDLLNQGSFTHLARASDHLNVPPRFAQPAD